MESKRDKTSIACIGTNCPIRYNCGKFFRMNYKDKCFEIIRAPIKLDRGRADCNEFEKI